MKLLSYRKEDQEQLAIYVDGLLYNMERFHPDMPGNMGLFLNYWDDLLPLARAGEMAVLDGHIGTEKGISHSSDVRILPPCPQRPLPAGTAMPSASMSPPPAATGACP